MTSIQIKSLPVEHVIRDIAEAYGAEMKSNCGEYTVDLPSDAGEGYITGIDTERGLGVLVYDCIFKNDTQIEFSLSGGHPLKFLYMLSGSIEHSFEKERENVHKIEEYQTSIVASSREQGHILLFKAGEHSRLHSLEIDRKTFTKRMECDVEKLEGDLKSLFMDFKAEKPFYWKDHFSLELAELFEKMYNLEEVDFLRKLYLEGVAYQILIKQIILYLDYREAEGGNVLRVNEVGQVKKAVEHIETNLQETPGVEELAREVGLNVNKLQTGFKLLYGNTVNRQIHKIRLEAARNLLLYTDHSVSEVAEKIGINSKSYFSKIFREHYEITPLEFRQKNKSVKRSVNKEEEQSGE